MKLKREHFRKLVFEQGYGIPALAAKAGVQDETLYKHLRQESKEMRWDTLLKVSKVLEVDPLEIADWGV